MSDDQIKVVLNATLTAARPHMEAAEAERIAAWITAEPQNDKRVNDTLILLADALRRGDHRAATIAERTNDEPAPTTEDEREGLVNVVMGVPAWPITSLDGIGQLPTPNLSEAGMVADALLAAGYRKRPTVTVEDVKAWALKEFGVSNGTQVWIEFQGDPDRFATAVLALINGESDHD